MAQFYFLSVLLNILAGLIFVYGLDLTRSASGVPAAADDGFGLDDDGGDTEASADGQERRLTRDFNGLNGRSLRLVIGVLSVVVGLLKVLSVYRNDVPVVGDLIPAAAGILGGSSLLMEYFLTGTTEDSGVPDGIQGFLIGSRRYIGVLCLVAAVLHFIFPQVLFL